MFNILFCNSFFKFGAQFSSRLCLKAVKENFTDKVFAPSSEVVIYDFGFNIVFVDGDCISIKTEDDSILGAWLISDEPIEPYHVEDIYEETLEARIRITS